MASRVLERRQVYYAGHVQGVGFRYTAQAIARGYPVTGFVRNLADGRVKLVVEGPARQLEALLQDLSERQGENIQSTTSSRLAATGQFVGFSIKY